MVPDKAYETCLGVLDDPQLEEEERTGKIEEILKRDLSLDGQALEDAVLDTLWRHRTVKSSKKSPPVRHAIVRAQSPSPWQQGARASTPSISGSPRIGRSSPVPRSSFGGAPPGFIRSKSFGTASPFSSPRASPRLAFASPMPHSPSLSNYEFSEGNSDRNEYGDYGSDTVDWLVNDDSGSRPSSSGAGSVSESGLNAAAAPFVQPQASEMSSYDILRSVMGDGKSDEDIEAALEASGYDLSSAIMNLMKAHGSQQDQSYFPETDGQVLIGKSMTATQRVAIDHLERGRSNVLCKYWLANGSCLRADCRFSHDLSGHICKYWLTGNCLAGDSCIFSHDPALLMSQINIGDGSTSTPPAQIYPNFQVQDYDAFPAIQSRSQMQQSTVSASQSYSHKSGGSTGYVGSPRRQFEYRPSARSSIGSSYSSTGSRPTSHHRTPQPSQNVSIPPVDDAEAFPTLGAAGVKVIKKHHGKRGGHGHGHANKENTPNSIADVVRMSPGPSPALLRKGLAKMRSSTSVSAAANAIPAPQHIPWLETGAKADQEYIKARQEAFKHGALRNKFLQSAAQAWNRSDARAAKALSLRGQSENDLMRKAHREAAHVLYESRNKGSIGSPEIYVDLHGLHPEEAISFLEDKLVEQRESDRTVYAITGTGHHSKNGKDKVGKAVRMWLQEWKYAFREFSAGGSEGMGGILGIDPASYDKGMLADKEGKEGRGSEEEAAGSSTKVRIVKAVDREKMNESSES